MNTLRTRRLVAAVVTAVTLATVTACGSAPPEPEESSSSQAPAQQWNPGDDPTTEPNITPPSVTTPSAAPTLPQGVEVNRSSAPDVAATAVKLWFTWDTRTDQSRSDAAARTAPLLTSTMRESVLANVSLRPSAQWRDWAAQGAVITPRVSAQGNQGAPDSSTRKYFVYAVTQTARAGGKTVGDPFTHTVWVITVKGPSGWEVSQIQEQQ